MKLLDMELENFRQFYGVQSMEFATGDSGKNITVFHGFNGAGKTALLNSFVWCLYNETTSDLEAPERLENERAVAEAKIGDELSVSVTLRFSMHGETFRVQRHRTSVKEGANELRRTTDALRLWKITRTGEFEPVGSSDSSRQKRVEQMLPKTLYPFFFFNGERVEGLASPDAYNKVEQGVKTLLDIAVYERGAGHLRGAVAKVLTSELKQYGDSELQDALQRLEDLDAAREVLNEDLQQRIRNIAALHDEIESIERKQASLAALASLAQKRDELRREVSRVEREIGDVRQATAENLSRDGYLGLCEPVLQQTEILVAEARHRGEIPAKIKPQFVDDLLDRRVCICGREIQEGSEEEHKLHAWRSATGLAEFEERISQTSAFIPRLRERAKDYFRKLDASNKKLQSLYNEQQLAKEELAVVEEQLGDPSVGASAAELQDLLGQRRRERDGEAARRIICDERIAELDEQRDEILRQVKRLEVQDKKAALVKRQREAVERVAEALDKVAILQKDDVRRSLDDQIQEIWGDAAIKDYRASVSEDYRLQLTKMVGGQRRPVHGASTGEKQVLALSFVGSLVHKARENAGQRHGINVGGHYPLVMDSPFGSLEDDYRSKVAEWIPTLADQVIVMASKSQWRNEVETAMRSRIGREYILELHTHKRGADRTIRIGEVDHPYVVSATDPIEQTIVRRV